MTFELEDTACPVCGGVDTSSTLTSHDYVLGDDTPWTVCSCTACTHGYLSPRPNPATIGDAYPNDYPEHQQSEPTPLSEANAAAAIRHQPGPGSVLDVGCASGAFLRSMAQRGWTATGFEPSEDAARMARTSETPVFTDLADDELRARTFDLITLWSALEHTHDPIATFREVRQLLADHGIVAGVVPNYASLERQIFGSRWFALEIPRHLQHFTPTSLRVAFARSGLRLTVLESTSGHDILVRSAKRTFHDLRGGAALTGEDANSGRTSDQSVHQSIDQSVGAPPGAGLVSRAKGLAVTAATRAADRASRGSQLFFVAEPMD